MAKGLVIITCGSLGNIQISLLQIIQVWESGGPLAWRSKLPVFSMLKLTHEDGGPPLGNWVARPGPKLESHSF